MKIISIFLVFILIFSNEIDANYVVISNGIIIDGENIHETQSVASISKVMTALIALEVGDITDQVIIDKKTTMQVGSSIYAQLNESYSLLSLIHGLLLRSGNDAAYAIAMHVGGSIDHFVSLMNEKAKDIGMVNTIFSNPSGLDEEDNGNISSVYDMALCMQEAMKNDLFRMIIKTKQYKAENNRIYMNKNRLFNIYEYTTGGKTGYTTKSGKTLITSSNYHGLESIVVSFREDDYFNFHKKMHEKVNNEYKNITLIEKGKYKRKNKVIHIKENINIIIKNNEEFNYSIELNQHEIIIKYNNQIRKVKI